MPRAATAKMDSSTLASPTTPARNARPSARTFCSSKAAVARRTAWTARVSNVPLWASRPVTTGGKEARPAAQALTWMADAGVELHILQRVAGHQDPAVTSRYLHPDVQAVLDAGRAFSAWWSKS